MHIGRWTWHIIIMVMPDEDAQAVLIEAGQRGDIRLVADAVGNDLLDGQAVVALYTESPAAHFAEHAENIQHGFFDAVAGQRSESGEVWLIFEFKSPGQRAF